LGDSLLMIISPEKFATRSLRLSPWGKKICQLLSAAIHNADAGVFVNRNISLVANKLAIQGRDYDLGLFNRIFLIGAGKAVLPMAAAVYDLLGKRITTGLLITKFGYVDQDSSLNDSIVKVIEASHPVPDQGTVTATAGMLSLVTNLNDRDLVICLVSGGGSSLMTSPAQGVSLRDIQETTTLLLKSGAIIDEINIVRKHLDDIKAGGLARRLYPATVIGLVLSDVIGDHPEMVASGPTYPDSTTFVDAQALLSKYQLLDHLPPTIRAHISAGVHGLIPETLKPGDPLLQKVQNFLVGDNSMAVSAAIRTAKALGFNAALMPFQLVGEARMMGKTITDYVRSVPHEGDMDSLDCYITGGETTVQVKGSGKGGRNQELALGAATGLSGPEEMILVSLATDGGDGPTDAAGAVVTNRTFALGASLGLNSADYLQNNDSYRYFNQLDDLIHTGPTLTNVNDLVFIFRGSANPS
jgi:glycerate 2-kinase